MSNNNIIISSEEEFNEYIKIYELSEKISLKEFKAIANALIKDMGGNFAISFAVHAEDLAEEETNILNDKIAKINKNRKDAITLYYLASFVLTKCIGEIEERFKEKDEGIAYEK